MSDDASKFADIKYKVITTVNEFAEDRFNYHSLIVPHFFSPVFTISHVWIYF